MSVDVSVVPTERSHRVARYDGGMITGEDSLAATVAASAASSNPSPSGVTTTAPRSAVLPRPGPAGAALPGERYAKKRVLGAGGMGEVVLAEDRDIGRNVALKYLTAPSHDKAALARFVDEIRTVGLARAPEHRSHPRRRRRRRTTATTS